MAKLRYSSGIATTVLIALAGCDARPQNPSSESELLQNQLVPAITKWSKTNSPTMNLFQSKLVRSFDYICIAQEYEPLNAIEAKAPYHYTYKGNLGLRVPEMNTAIIGVKKNVAHVAYYPMYPLALYSHKRCTETSFAILTMEDGGETYPSTARLGERK